MKREDVERLVDARVALRLEGLERRVAVLEERNAVPSAPAVSDVAAVSRRILDVVHKLNRHFDGLVPLWEIRVRLRPVPREEVDEALLQLERDRHLYLKVADDPVALGARREDGIVVHGRGTLFWATLP